MAQLSADDRKLLNKFGIREEETFDATGYSSSIWKLIMKREGKKVAYGTSPCGRHGHRLRTRHNHCIHCNPRQLAHYQRALAARYVYIAGSKDLELIKVGSTSDYHERQRGLNSEYYGGTDDWKLIYAALFSGSTAYSAERRVHSWLSCRQVQKPYSDFYGNTQYARELFKANASHAACYIAEHPSFVSENFKASGFEDFDFCGNKLH